MTTIDFINGFDILYNNLMSDKAPEINEYEKSVLLTLAQEQIVKEIYLDKFEGSEEQRRSIDVLVTQKDIKRSDKPHKVLRGDRFYHSHYVLPEDLWYIVHETARFSDRQVCNNGDYVPVKPETYDEALHDVRNPFRGPTMNRVLRVDYGTDGDGDRLVELISKYEIDRYSIRYVRHPQPILLVDFRGDDYAGVTIRGKDVLERLLDKNGELNINATPCELPPVIHDQVLGRAVAIAINV